jgi:hypothetical protein
MTYRVVITAAAKQNLGMPISGRPTGLLILPHFGSNASKPNCKQSRISPSGIRWLQKTPLSNQKSVS